MRPGEEYEVRSEGYMMDFFLRPTEWGPLWPMLDRCNFFYTFIPPMSCNHFQLYIDQTFCSLLDWNSKNIVYGKKTIKNLSG